MRNSLSLAILLYATTLLAPPPTPADIAEERGLLVQSGPKISVSLTPRLDLYYFSEGVMKKRPPPAVAGKIPVSLRFSGKNNLGASLELIAATPSGRALLAKALPEFDNGKLEVRALTSALRNQWNLPYGGFCEPDYEAEGKRTIYVDPSSPPGELAAILFHELTHGITPEDQSEMRRLETKRRALAGERRAVDALESPNLFRAEALKRDLAAYEKERQEATLKIELRAHRAHEAYVMELKEEFPETAIFYAHLSKIGALTAESSEADIISSYKLNRLPNAFRCNVPMKRIAS